MQIPFFGKIFIMSVLVSLSCGYALLEKRKYDSWKNHSPSLILKSMPHFKAYDIGTKNDVTGPEILAKFDRGLFVHFWGTWCVPCESELPELVDFARLYEDKGVGFVFLSVKDDEREIKKFLSRFKRNFPKNIAVVHDKEGMALNDFGTFKVPETYLFATDGTHLRKFVGPQNWAHPSYQNRIDIFLGDGP